MNVSIVQGSLLGCLDDGCVMVNMLLPPAVDEGVGAMVEIVDSRLDGMVRRFG